MSKKLFVLLIVLMSLSLIGIIFVQAYFITDSVKNEQEQFTFKVKKALSYTSKAIQDNEYREYVRELQKFLASGGSADSTSIRELTFYKPDENSNELIIYRNGILEENFKVPSFIDISIDSVNISRITNRRKTEIYNTRDVDGSGISIEPVRSFEEVTRLSKTEQAVFETYYKEQAKRIPVHNRVSNEQLKKLLSKKLKEDDIDIDFEYAIYANDLATKIQSKKFELDLNSTSTYGVPIFLDNNNESDFSLYVEFPERNKFILSTVIGVTLLAILFTVVIILAFSSAIYQLIRQRQISQIKTDFINNMTHEFKTPIATINLALDSIKNPKIINDEDRVIRYLKMIKDENKRMHAQVENVLRISKLEKNELNISKERLKLHDLVEDAVSHVELIVEDRNGYVKTHLNALKSSVLANETHFTNVIVNMLDNAVKYSEGEPKIDVFTENVGTNIILKIQDQGNGMSKAVQKRIFEKFYREHTGDIHNVKGHGLGLAYVKQIVDDHQGHVSVESEKGKGSTFIIKLPLIS